jgi:Ca2+-binding EF-hand superfamily protein
MLKLNLSEDNIQESIQSIAGKGKQHITWEQFNIFVEKKAEKRTVKY